MYYTSDQSAWLDKDSMKGYGPEALNIDWMHATCYRVMVHAHSTEVPLIGCGAKVTLYDSEGWCGHVAVVQATGVGRYWHVFDMDGETGEVVVFVCLSICASITEIFICQ